MATEKKKETGLKNKSLTMINQNEAINLLFDETATIHKEMHEEYSIRRLPLCSEEQKIRYSSQRSYNQYIFSLLEDIHRSSYFALCGVYLYEDRLNFKDDKEFFSSRYFLANASFHTMGAWERLLRLAGLLYGYDFTKHSMKSTQLYEALKKMVSFNSTDAFRLIKGLKENNHFPNIEKLRIRNDHKLSMHVEYETDDELKKLAASCYENAKALYQIIPFYIERLKNECFIRPEGINLQMFNWEQQLDPKKIEHTVTKELQRELLRFRMDRCSEYLKNEIYTFEDLRPVMIPFLTKLNDTSQFILYNSDVVFRLHEANRSLRFAYSLIGKAKKEGTELYEECVCFVDMNYTYFVESAISRIYSVYDKIAILLHLHTGAGSSTNTFEQFIRNNDDVPNNKDLLGLAIKLHNTEVYKELHQLRQDNYHHMIKENFIHKVDSDWSHIYNMVLASKNIENLKALVMKLMELFVEDPLGFRK